MDHIVYLDAKEGELQKLLDGSKTMIVRGAAGRKLPHGRVHVGDRLFLIENDGSGLVRAAASVSAVIHSEKLEERQSVELLAAHQPALRLSPLQIKRWAGKRYLVLIGLTGVEALAPFAIDRSEYGNMDDWLPVGDIERVRKDSA